MAATIFTGTGSYIPDRIVTNAEFGKHSFYTEDQALIPTTWFCDCPKVQNITGIEERRYVADDLLASDIGAIAARLALDDAGISGEQLDQLIVAHNFGEVRSGTIQTDILPGFLHVLNIYWA
jgi:3-oxoacyl-[acyl-carrier-protein] synthase-3